jgi:hypothetical protein
MQPVISADRIGAGSREVITLVRRIVIALAAMLVAGSVGVAPAQAAEAPDGGPKIVFIVGATHGTTQRYREYADAAAAVASEYTSNVVKVYSPNATWAAVKAAIQGANVVVYMGHGNGFPSPYRTSPWPYSQNGFGLNAVAGQGDHNNTYYGEQYIGNEVKLARNALVILNHLCYASGNSEPGQAAPTLEVARQRVDNYAAGFLKAGAAAVIAEGHRGPEAYIRALFESPRTLDSVWHGVSFAKGNDFSFPSARTAGAIAQMDPDSPSGGYYRAMTGNPQVFTSEITGIAGVTGVNPSTVVGVQITRP